jgi:hypothetical protein
MEAVELDITDPKGGVSFDEGASLIFRRAPVVSRRTHMPYINALPRYASN